MRSNVVDDLNHRREPRGTTALARERDANVAPNAASDAELVIARVMAPKKPAQKSAKAQIKEQRDQIRQQIKTIRDESASTHVLDSLYDAALGLELWLRTNSSAFPSAAVKQKTERLGEIATQATRGTLDADAAYWELAGLYTIIHRECQKEDLGLVFPSFVFPDGGMPALGEGDALTLADVREAIGCELTAEALDAKIAELEEIERAKAALEAMDADA